MYLPPKYIDVWMPQMFTKSFRFEKIHHYNKSIKLHTISANIHAVSPETDIMTAFVNNMCRRPSDEYIYIYAPVNWASICLDNGLSVPSHKPLSKPVLEYCQLDPCEQTSMKFESKYRNFHSWKCIWKFRLRNGGHLSTKPLSERVLPYC